MTNLMHLLEPKRVIEDEELFRTLKIGFSIATHPKAAKCILAMRAMFQKYNRLMNAVAIVAEKAI